MVERGFRVAFFGTPDFAVPALTRLAGTFTVAVVVTQPDRPRGRGQKSQASPVKQFAGAHGIPVLQPTRLKDPAFLEALRSFDPDLGVVAAYGRILPAETLALPRLGMVNVHASMLPKYRGASPVHRAVMNGDTETGVTIMRVVQALDAGPMIAAARRPIGPDETSDVVERDLASLGADLLMRVLPDVATGRAQETPQDDSLATYAPRLTKDEGRIDWREPAIAIHNKVRGLYPWPHAFTFAGEMRLIVLGTRTGAATDAVPAPGTIVKSSGDDLVVAAGHKTMLQILSLQAEGKRPMTTREFLSGRPLSPGLILS